MSTRLASWVHRLVIGGLLLIAYLWAWTPARTAWVEYGAAPLLETVMERADTEGTIAARPADYLVRLEPSRRPDRTYRAPAGVKFLLPAFFLILVVPRRLYVGLFFAGHLLLGLTSLAFFTGGAAGVPVSLWAADYVQTYVVDAYSLTVPLLALVRLHAPQTSASDDPENARKDEVARTDP